MSLIFQKATPNDLAVVEGLVERAFSAFINVIGKKPGPMLDDYAAAIATGEVWLAEDAGLNKGMLYLIPCDGYLDLETLAVDPQWHGQGVGKALLAFTEERAKALGYRDIHVYTNQKFEVATQMYPRYGYAEVHRGEEKGYQRVYYRKTL